MYQLLQTTAKLPHASNHTSCCIQHSLQLGSDSLRSPSENNVAAVDPRHHKGMHSVIADSIPSVRRMCQSWWRWQKHLADVQCNYDLGSQL